MDPTDMPVVPPACGFFSTTTTLAPRVAASIAAASPAPPAPTTRTSQRSPNSTVDTVAPLDALAPLFGLRTGFLSDLCPASNLVSQERRCVRGRHPVRNHSLPGELLLHFGYLGDPLQRGAQFVHNVLGHAGRSKYCPPRLCDELRHSELLERRDVGQRINAVRRGDRVRPQLSRLDE